MQPNLHHPLMDWKLMMNPLADNWCHQQNPSSDPSVQAESGNGNEKIDPTTCDEVVMAEGTKGPPERRKMTKNELMKQGTNVNYHEPV